MASGKTYAYLGIASAVFSLIIAPIIFGPIAVILGYMAWKEGEKTLGTITIILGIVLALISWILAIIFLSL